MIVVKLREAIEEHERRTGTRITYEFLAKLTGLSKATLESVGTRSNYNTRLSTIDKICRALQCTPGELLEIRKAQHPNLDDHRQG
jgi:DNA-binding Xre family transcriptional regulator